MSAFITCIDPECKVLINDDLVQRLLDTETRQMYQKLITDAYVLSNRTMSWCPAPGCPKALSISSFTYPGVTCSCDNSFCMSCHDSYHDPVTCDLLKKWQKIIKYGKDEHASNEWIEKNSKPCPQCKTPIEKNGGCNHMTCRSQSCRYEFCWICLGNWKTHNSHGCNQYVAPTTVKMSNHDPELFLARLMHYQARFEAHKQSWKLERPLSEKVTGLIATFETERDRARFTFLENGVKVLGSCRQILQNTFIFAFLAERNNQIEIFEENQRDLEQATEILSAYFERELSYDTLDQLREMIFLKYTYCQKRRKILLDHIQEGFEKGFWKFIEN